MFEDSRILIAVAEVQCLVSLECCRVLTAVDYNTAVFRNLTWCESDTNLGSNSITSICCEFVVEKSKWWDLSLSAHLWHGVRRVGCSSRVDDSQYWRLRSHLLLLFFSPPATAMTLTQAFPINSPGSICSSLSIVMNALVGAVDCMVAERGGQNKQRGVGYRSLTPTAELFRPLALVLIRLQLLRDITLLKWAIASVTTIHPSVLFAPPFIIWVWAISNLSSTFYTFISRSHVSTYEY